MITNNLLLLFFLQLSTLFVKSSWSFLLPAAPLRTTHHHTTTTRRKKTDVVRVGRVQQLQALVPLPVDELEEYLVLGPPSGPQYATYWGRTRREQYNRFLESSIVTFLGVFFSYFMSFVLGGFIATIFGALFFFYSVLSPELKARQRNWEFLGGRNLVDPWTVGRSSSSYRRRGGGEEDEEDYYEDRQGLYGSLFLGKVDDVCVVESTSSVNEYDLDEFQDYTMETDDLEQLSGTPYLIRVKVSDNEGRDLQVHARMSEDYLGVRQGMPVLAILLSKSQSFSSLAALTDFMIPDADCWIGDYPYLNRPEVEARLAEDDEIWELLTSQGTGDYIDETTNNDDGDDDDLDQDTYYLDEKVPVRRRKK